MLRKGRLKKVMLRPSVSFEWIRAETAEINLDDRLQAYIVGKSGVGSGGERRIYGSQFWLVLV